MVKKRIYAADDDENILQLIKTFLVNDGYDVSVFTTGDGLFEAFEENPCDLVILDIMMPGTDGLMICNKLRSKSKVPIILLTAKDTDADHIAGIYLGSDDYLTKPFRPTRLNMRVKALLRRVEMEREESRLTKNIEYGDLKLVPNERTVYCNGKDLGLTSTEYLFFAYLFEHSDMAVSRDDLLEKVWGYSTEVETRVTDETTRRIRKKLKALNSNIEIKTIWGFGYRLVISNS